LIFRDSYNWILRIQKKIDTRASIYVMFRDCARLKRDVFVTWKENDVNEQDVGERKECWERKRILSHIWVKSESDLGQISTRSLTSSNQSWYARNTTWTTIHCSLSFKIMSHWSFSSISILMILSDWSITHWRSCWLMLMFHEIATFWDFAEALKEIRKTYLLAMLLSRWAVHDSTDSELCIIVKD